MAKKRAAKENVCKKAANGVTDSFNVFERVTKLSDGYFIPSVHVLLQFLLPVERRTVVTPFNFCIILTDNA
jgi:hypothetical protein